VSAPAFAVVGHPNKGKSSIVSTLALDDTVAVSPTPGTTTHRRAFPLRVDGTTLYTLFDTPGFQRPRAVLEWLTAETVPADRRADRVRQFLHEHRTDPRFRDEVELLTPVMDGAGILYVVDGSRPYGPEYETEMEILRWTGQPSMALVNRIGDTDHTDEWKRALGHYFRLVRTFDPMRAGFPQHLELLEAMAQLNEAWTAPLKEAAAILTRDQRRKTEAAAAAVTDLVAGSLSQVMTVPIRAERATEAEKRRLHERYRARLRERETLAYGEIARIWNHQGLEALRPETLLGTFDLFSEESTSLFGLRRRDLIVLGVAGGAAGGAGIDLLAGGHTLGLGTAAGALLGGGSAALGFGKLADTKILGHTVATRRLRMGPVRDVNFPFVLLRRALYFAKEVANRPHADRRNVTLAEDTLFTDDWIDTKTKKELAALHKKLATAPATNEKAFARYREIVTGLLREEIPGG
jgi:GTPase Era involved in 16S rRNA processing